MGEKIQKIVTAAISVRETICPLLVRQAESGNVIMLMCCEHYWLPLHPSHTVQVADDQGSYYYESSARQAVRQIDTVQYNI